MKLAGHEGLVLDHVRSEHYSSLSKLDNHIPLATIELLISLGLDRIPDGVSFAGTNLTGCEGKSIFELPQPDLEKLVLWAAGFTRNEKYTATKIVNVPENYDLSLVCNEITEKVESFLAQNCNTGIRIHNKKSNGSTTKPLGWVTIKNPSAYLRKENNILQLRLVDGSWYDIKDADEIKLFSSPDSIDADVLLSSNDSDEQQKDILLEKNINLGGGFICSLEKYYADSQIFVLQFYFIANNGNPRNIGDNNPYYPEEKISIDVKIEDGKFFLIEDFSEKLSDVIATKNFRKILEYIAKGIIESDSEAMCQLFAMALNLYPAELGVHAIKGLYAVEKVNKKDQKLVGDVLKTSSLVFDFEGLEQAELWDKNFNLANLKDPSPLLKLVYEKVGAKQRVFDPRSRLLLAQLALNDNFANLITLDENIVMVKIEAGLRKNLDKFLSRVEDELSEADSKTASQLAQQETEKIIKSLFSQNQYKNNSPESIFGKLLWTMVTRKNMRKLTKTPSDHKVADGFDLYEYQLPNSNTRALIIDQGDVKIGFLIENGALINLENLLTEKTIKHSSHQTFSNLDKVKATSELLSEKFNLEVPKATYRYVLD